MSALLSVDQLSVAFRRDALSSEEKSASNTVVNRISFTLKQGEITALVGESGSGKSVTAHSILRLLPYPAASHPSGQIHFDGKDLLHIPEPELRQIRGKRISMIFQEPMTSLNPLHTLEKQLSEAILLHTFPTPDRKVLHEKIASLLRMVELDALTSRLDAYPHELSGGQRQRVMIAMALANDPDLLIADEPTTALDVTVQAEILNLLSHLRKTQNMAILLITHDLSIVRHMADQVLVMHQGELVESGAMHQVFDTPKHAYTRKLLSSAPSGDPIPAKKDATPIVTTEKLTVRFPLQKSFWGKPVAWLEAVKEASVEVKQGHTLGVVGESGSGKTTLALAILRLLKSSGRIVFQSQDIATLSSSAIKPLRRQMQLVFQDPFSSLNPRMSIAEIIGEGLGAHGLVDSRTALEERVQQALKEVGLSPDMANRYPHEFSGGQRQRISIARALVLKPALIVLDEPTSALDVSTQKAMLELLKSLQRDHHLSYIFISHDLRVIKSISHDIIVMKDGTIVESGTNNEIFSNPSTDYTRRLIEASLV